ncbi:3-hydroxyacyl-CoA dehydrogenase [Haloferax mediterranei ATCC 33500]|uniref:enoyl-CoA hydratase n=1 Tax=Haloferax mediterranei (strain ATCC 33500 / DSM 1411 / JCM 8866 / NBRC 14739 / NCIMB 2177 / R-4) TaxID=523841 RepID=I3R8E2_HALMT|nr:3-hydroxyacyl-CoA dehydrogenase/enoyl-CoA hydratase family protein [Haloferax mediterranei]AFK20502.1 3-hydroxyacyl-CoA dehydrogenase [Haloferax mediterranei ATCC 33500]AHZ23861.1 3-hydroxyacyl-CoA dehydrogenase [Haloferax mediterranei ATCC 33500]ELZ98285.1 3-hydroxyacyl-CoA dehydrogenase [Haloferax mediterranei ATCC 33500]MDX5986742.1 3-hydroxyacyl-CoA dehydrogenase NAD-binding domain-containing protein [Haloferax mediterranei ATCC 33500]QCQ76066.1 3-hydroxyacyl-CoA dehydrogenase [Halofera
MKVDEINTITVLGAGNMGHGIAEVAALAGYNVVLRDIKEEFVQKGYDQIEWSLNKLAEKDRLSQEDADAALDRVTAVVDLGEAVSDTDVVIEAVPEKMSIKKEVYAELEEHAPDHTIFATNTSSLSITELSEVTERPERFCGMHFFNPPVRMDLVEVISGAHTDDETLDVIEDLAEEMGKTPVRVRKDSPGFIVNRILVPLMNEAAWTVHAGDATIAEVDSTTKYDLGLPMGSFELADQVGVDVGYHVLEYMHDVLGDAYAPCPLLSEKVEEKNLGKKTGKGFYDYEDGEGAQIPHGEGSEKIKNRLLALMANEVAGLVENEVADPDAIDRAVMLGAGFPDGPAKMADEADIPTLVETLDELHEETGEERYEVVEYLRELAEFGEGFHGGDEEDEGGLEFDNVAVDVREGIGHITLDRPHRLNTISTELMDELSDALDVLEDDDEVRAILLTGAGERAFSAGADVTSIAAGGGDAVSGVEISRKGQQTFGKLEDMDKPVIAGIDGFCLGGGMELATCADLRIATERSKLGQPEHDLGLIPGWGGTVRLQRIVGTGRAKEIIFSAERYDAETMADYGFINEVVENEDFEERAFEYAKKFAQGPPIAQRYTKRAMHNGWENTDAGLEIEAQGFGLLFTTADLMEGIAAFTSDRDPEFTGE